MPPRLTGFCAADSRQVKDADKVADVAWPTEEHPQLAQPEDAQQAIWNLPVDSEERRKLAETVQSLRFQHDAPETDAD